MNLKPGKQIYIQSFKHDGTLHRTWSMGFVFKADEKETVVVTNKTWVTESDGRKWYTREPAICYFYPDHWFNIICMMRKSGVFYYCNLASPAIWDGEALKHIDYDLDIKVYPDGSMKLLDEDEWEEHSKTMNYPADLKKIIWAELDVLENWIKQKHEPFKPKELENVFHEYMKMLENNDHEEYMRVRHGE